MADLFNLWGDPNSPAPARRCVAVAPHDTDALPSIPKALYIGGGGTIVLRAVDDSVDSALPVQSGAILPIRAQYVRATGTTASGIFWLL